jgi:hypothetical protein
MDEKDLQQTPMEPTEPIQQTGPVDPLPDMQISALRTYKNDINHTVSEDKISTAKIMLAEQKAQEKKQEFIPETSVKKPRNIFALLFGLIFIAGAVGVLGFFAYTKLVPQTPNIAFNTSSFFLFAFDDEKFVDTKKSKTSIYAAVDTAIQEVSEMNEGTYTDIVFFRNDEEMGTSNRILAKEFFSLYDVDLPANIELSISDNFSYGMYRTDTSVEPFLVIGLVDFENAYASMFAWEPTLALDMKEFFPVLAALFADGPEVPEEVTVATTTATTTIATSSVSVATSTKSATTTPAVATSTQSTTTPAYKPINRNVQFTDVVLANRDTRALRDENGNPYFYYAFIDKDKILFAQDSKLIGEIVRKVREKQLVR